MEIFALASFAFSFAASVAILVLLIVAAVGFAIWAYRHTVPEVTRAKRIQLVTFRSIALAILLFLIFEPVLNLERSDSAPPEIVVLVDDSKSMTVEDQAGIRGDILKRLISSGEYSAIGDLGNVRPVLFGGKTRFLSELSPDSIDFRGGETDISTALENVTRELEDRNLQAVVLMTDGSYTTGKNPLYSAEMVGAPIFVVGIGDSTEKRDLIVRKVVANDIAYVKSRVPIDATIRSAGYDGGETVVSLREGTRNIQSKTIALREGVNEYPVSFEYEAESDGTKRLSVHVAPLPGELTEKNNNKSFFVKVLKSRMKVALVAGAPSADVALMERVLRKDRNVDVTGYIQKIGNTWYGTPPDQKSFLEADCIFLIGYPIRQSAPETLDQIRQAVDKAGTPLFILFSRNIDAARLKNGLDAYLPFDIIQLREDETQVFFEPAAGAGTHPVISTTLGQDAFKDLPPLFKTESSFKLRVGGEALGMMKINNIVFSEPLLIARKLHRSKVIAMLAYGLWQWEFAREAPGESVNRIMVANALRWLTTREDDKFVRIRPAREFFDSGEPVEFVAQVYNESYEPVDDASVTVAVDGPAGRQELVLTSAGAGRYLGSVESMREGDYRYTGIAQRGNMRVGDDKGRFSVGELNVEFQETKMNNLLLRQMAAGSGGKYYSPETFPAMAEDIARTPGFGPKEQVIRSDIQLWNIIWLLAAAVIFFALEWYFRKQAGMI